MRKKVMTKSKKQIPQKSTRLVDAVRQSSVAVRKNSQSFEAIQHKTRLGVVYIAVKDFVRRAPENLKVGVSRAGRSRQRILGKIAARLPKIALPQFQASNRLKSVVASTSLVVMMVLMFFNMGVHNVARAFDTLNQSDWSGGQGISPVNQYEEKDGNVVTATAGQLSLSGGASAWCSTANCNTNWTRRKVLVPRGGINDTDMTYAQVQLTVEYENEMKSDFSDLRFTNRYSNQDVPYWVMRKTDGVSATVFLKIQLSSGGVDSHTYMYYGNAAATSLSSKGGVFDLYDSYDTGSLQGNYFDIDGADGEIDGLGGKLTRLDYGISHPGPFSRDRTRVYEADLKLDLSSYTCGDSAGVGSIEIGFQGGTAELYFDMPANCDSNGKYWRVSGATNGSESVNFPDSTAYHFTSNIYVRLRLVAYQDGGHAYFFSRDNGETYTAFPGVNTGINSDNFPTEYYLSNGNAVTTYRHVVAYQGLLDRSTSLNFDASVEEYVNGRVGGFTSVEYDLGSDRTFFGDLNITYTGTGAVGVYISGSDTPGGTLDSISMYVSCPFVKNTTAISSDCLPAGSRYVRYYLLLSSDAANSLVIQDVSLEYSIDVDSPTIVSGVQTRRTSNNAVISTGWINETPKFSWNASVDGVDGSGIAGYCLYFGTDSGADLSTTQGLLPTTSPYDTGGLCQYAIQATSLDLSQLTLQSSLTTNTQYHLKIQPFDNAGNLATATTSALGYDTDTPGPYTTAFGPNGYVNSPIQPVNWAKDAPAMVVDDGGSGVAGIKYCVFSYATGDGCSLFGGSPSDFPWYGPARTNSLPNDPIDVYSFSSGGFNLVDDDLARMTDEGLNGVVLLLIDNAGNVAQFGSGGAPVIINVTQQPPSAPQNLQVSPSSNNENAFSFTWAAPATASGPTGQVDYCWTVNVSIASDGSNCNWTGQGITQLAQGAYATQQGSNTLYLMAKDQSQNFSNANVTSVNFTATTVAPGPPQNLELSDVSIRATSSWKIALSWSAPQLPGSGIASYKIYRSTNNVNFTEVGTTSSTNLSFIDSGLSQTDYYYYVKACDDADSCSVASNTETKYPNGRYTTPARLTDDTDQPKIRDIGTRKATIYWFTDRASDSKIAYGTAPGQYFPEEVGNSTQDSSHVVNLTNLEPGKTYYYVARWTDEDGNTGISQERAFTTLPAPTVREVSASNLTISSAAVNFTTENAYKANVYFGTSDAFGGVKSINTSISSSSYSLSLNDLQDGQKYFYKISTVDADGYEYQGDIYSFTTPARPKITNLRFETVEGEPSSTQKIVWTTNVATTSEVVYGLVGGEQSEAVSSTLVTEHEVIVRGLADNADYELVARSRDAAGNLAVSDKQFFQTAEDTRAPKVSEFKVETDIRGTGGEARGQIIVSWRTDEPATSQVAFAKGRTTELSNRSSQDTRLTTEHVVVVSDLTTSSIYQVQAVSADKAGNESFSDAQTAIIGRGTENIFSIIFNALQAIFGFGDTNL